MRLETDNLTSYSLLAVFAHPDDESLACGGLLAWCADRGARVALLCATHGEQGPNRSGNNKTPAQLGSTRARELKQAAKVLGLSDVVLLDYPDGSLKWSDTNPLKEQIVDAIQKFRPDIVITFGRDGLYWHPDHIAIHESTTAACATMGTKAPALYYVTMPPDCVKTLVDTVSSRPAAHALSKEFCGISDLNAFGAQAGHPTLVLNVGCFAIQKLSALRCHQTLVAGSVLMHMTDRDAEELFSIEHFHRSIIGQTHNTFLESLPSRPNK